MSRNSSDFDLSDEILSVIPTDPYDQLDIARRITSLAISSRVSRLEGEAGRLRQNISDRDRVIHELHEKIAHLDRMAQESDARLRETLKENARLLKERDIMAATSTKLAKDLSKLESFKRQLLKSMSHNNLSQLSETVHTGMYQQPIARVTSWIDDASFNHFELDEASGSAENEDSTQDEPMHVPQFSTRQQTTPRRSPNGTPSFSPANGSPKGLLRGGSSPRVSSRTPSPIKSQVEQRTSPPPIQRSSPPSSPPNRQTLPERAPRIEGKELFRQASRVASLQVRDLRYHRSDFPMSNLQHFWLLSKISMLKDNRARKLWPRRKQSLVQKTMISISPLRA
ncbi:uncharacterized protein At4g15545-like isoform X1 [Zingiber officinale]|uniref:uncharacterized protein At4g15545-like isoform X1 n=1 Tax=Zingiber officinale TaxID=94328 RepID=UPI001C4C7369|nr:uncharacterized protein At4g15545-like isoform X1 [Zingiber officinale]